MANYHTLEEKDFEILNKDFIEEYDDERNEVENKELIEEKGYVIGELIGIQDRCTSIKRYEEAILTENGVPELTKVIEFYQEFYLILNIHTEKGHIIFDIEPKYDTDYETGKETYTANYIIKILDTNVTIENVIEKIFPDLKDLDMNKEYEKREF